jgi:hypothetical protein
MLRYPLLLSLCGLAAALKSPMGVTPVLAVTKAQKKDSKGAVFDMPPIEVGLQIDFEVSLEPEKGKPVWEDKALPHPSRKLLVKEAASSSIANHKYATLVWAALLFVWTPLAIVLFCYTLFGKEFLIDILVTILPEQVPARHIEMVIEDGLWVGIFAACFAAAIGAFLVESTTLAIDVVKGILPDSYQRKENR